MLLRCVLHSQRLIQSNYCSHGMETLRKRRKERQVCSCRDCRLEQFFALETRGTVEFENVVWRRPRDQLDFHVRRMGSGVHRTLLHMDNAAAVFLQGCILGQNLQSPSVAYNEFASRKSGSCRSRPRPRQQEPTCAGSHPAGHAAISDAKCILVGIRALLSCPVCTFTVRQYLPIAERHTVLGGSNAVSVNGRDSAL